MRLVDCFAELFSYALNLQHLTGVDALSFDEAFDGVSRLLEQSQHCALKQGVKDNIYQDARFAVCAWTDEIILCSTWENKETWKKHQLQRLHFNTNNAGVEFFERLAKLPAEQSGAREVFAMCLALGFRGRFFHEDHTPELEDVIKDNLKKLTGMPFLEAHIADERLFPAAYQPKSGITKVRKAFRPFDWYLIAIPIVSVAILAELYIFYRNSLNIMILQFFGTL